MIPVLAWLAIALLAIWPFLMRPNRRYDRRQK